VKKLSWWEISIGFIGIALILLGYYISSLLFSGAFTTTAALFVTMVVILAFVIVGTYFFYKGSVSLLLNAIRKKKNGYLNVYEVLSLSSIMFRMKSNALLLTIITTVSALAIGLLSLSYISYYSAEQSAENYIPSHFSVNASEDATKFTSLLEENGIAYTEKRVEVIQAQVNVEQILAQDPDALLVDTSAMTLPVVSDQSVDGIDLSEKETLLTGYNDMMASMMRLQDSGEVVLLGTNLTIPLQYMGLEKDYVVSYNFTSGLPVMIVDETVFQQLKNHVNPDIQRESTLYIGIDIQNQEDIQKADALFSATFEDDFEHLSRLKMTYDQKLNMGLVIFIVGFLGLSFLVTSGCILYIKQMNESEDEKGYYTILRKLGFTQGDLLKGIQAKQLFNFGIPLVLGLFHSYFAVKSGWFFFGTELWAPMIVVMLIYTALYSIFGFLSVLYCKKVIKEAL
jgi:bacitracin transport system permease protein